MVDRVVCLGFMMSRKTVESSRTPLYLLRYSFQMSMLWLDFMTNLYTYYVEKRG